MRERNVGQPDVNHLKRCGCAYHRDVERRLAEEGVQALLPIKTTGASASAILAGKVAPKIDRYKPYDRH
jgi:hypothetical protein